MVWLINESRRRFETHWSGPLVLWTFLNEQVLLLSVSFRSQNGASLVEPEAKRLDHLNTTPTPDSHWWRSEPWGTFPDSSSEYWVITPEPGTHLLFSEEKAVRVSRRRRIWVRPQTAPWGQSHFPGWSPAHVYSFHFQAFHLVHAGQDARTRPWEPQTPEGLELSFVLTLRLDIRILEPVAYPSFCLFHNS